MNETKKKLVSINKQLSSLRCFSQNLICLCYERRTNKVISSSHASHTIRGLRYHGKFRMDVLSIDINAASSGKLLFTSAKC